MSKERFVYVRQYGMDAFVVCAHCQVSRARKGPGHLQDGGDYHMEDTVAQEGQTSDNSKHNVSSRFIYAHRRLLLEGCSSSVCLLGSPSAEVCVNTMSCKSRFSILGNGCSIAKFIVVFGESEVLRRFVSFYKGQVLYK